MTTKRMCRPAQAAGRTNEVPTALGTKSRGKRRRQAVLGPPAGAVRRHDDVGGQVGERIDGRLDDRLEPRPGEVEPAEQSVQAIDAREPHGVPRDVDGAGVAAAGEHDQSPAPHVYDECLVVDDQRVGLPATVALGLVERHALFELGRAVDLAGDEHAAVQQE
jgi:hypothetical protein